MVESSSPRLIRSRSSTAPFQRGSSSCPPSSHRLPQQTAAAPGGGVPRLPGEVGEPLGQVKLRLRLGYGGEGQPLAPGSDGSEHRSRVLRKEQEGGVGRPLLQQLQKGVLGRGVHILGVVKDIDLPGALVGPDIGVAPGLPGLSHGDILPICPHLDHIGVDAAKNLFAGSAPAAGSFLSLSGADHGGGQKPGQGALPRARRPADQIGMAQPPALLLGGELLLQGGVARQRGKFHGLRPAQTARCPPQRWWRPPR